MRTQDYHNVGNQQHTNKFGKKLQPYTCEGPLPSAGHKQQGGGSLRSFLGHKKPNLLPLVQEEK